VESRRAWGGGPGGDDGGCLPAKAPSTRSAPGECLAAKRAPASVSRSSRPIRAAIPYTISVTKAFADANGPSRPGEPRLADREKAFATMKGKRLGITAPGEQHGPRHPHGV